MSDNPPVSPSVSGDLSGLKPGEIFWNNYRVIGIVGKGGVSTVYKAERTDTKQLVAIKVLHASRSKDEELVRRFVRECQTTTRLEHPNAIKIYEWGIDNQERPFMIIEYLNGDTLAKRIQKGNGLNCNKAVEIMEQICSAIAEAHSLGIIHRDLKPENIMLTTHNGLEDFVKVVDFGIAKLEQSDDPASVQQASLTRTGAILGTPLYMSPEQLKGRKADARSDIYALGVIMYEMLTGKPPFASKNTAEIVVGHLNATPQAPTKLRMDLNIPEALSEATMRALNKNPWDRPTTVQEFCNALTKAIDKKEAPAAPVMILQPKAATPTPHGMVIDPGKRVCPRCKTVASGGNFRYCLKCGQHNTNSWLPYHKKSGGASELWLLLRAHRPAIFLVVLGVVLIWAAQSYLAHARVLTGRFEASFDQPLFAGAPGLTPATARKLQLSNLNLLLAETGDSVGGLVISSLGQDRIEGKVISVSPMIVSYELTSSIPAKEGRIDIEMTGTLDKVTRKEDWTARALYTSRKMKPITCVSKMHLQHIADEAEREQ